MKKPVIYIAGALLSFIAGVALAATPTSTITPTIPVNGQALDATPIRNNFAAAFNDVNSLWSYYTAIPSTPMVLTNKSFDTAGVGNSFKINSLTINNVQGLSSKVQLASGTITEGDFLAYDANGNAVDSGVTIAPFGSADANTVYAGPTSGSASAPDFRALVSADLPSTFSVSGTITAAGFSGPLTGAVTGDVSGNLTGNVTGDVTGNLTGNVTGNVSGTAGNITASSNTTLTSLANLATVGTITSGTWHGTTIGTSYLPTATSSAKGVVQTDGSTIMNSSGTISCTTGTSSQLGCLKPDGTTITASSGSISAVNSVRSIDVQKFTASGTYTPNAHLLYADTYAIGGGGGGGGCTGGSSQSASGGGGGGGGFARKLFTAATIGASQTVTIGSGGSGGSGANNGVAGGNTTFGALLTGNGGSGGGYGTTYAYITYHNGGAGGTASGGDLNLTGGYGGVGGASGNNNPGGYGGQGGSTPFAQSVISSVNNAGTAATGYGGGGSGAGCTSSDAAGGAGASGIVYVVEYNYQ